MSRLTCLIVLIGLLGTGCVRVNHKANFPQNKPIAMSSSLGGERQAVLVRHFTERDRQVYFFLFWVPLNNAGGAQAAEKHLVEGDGIANLSIRTSYGPADMFFTLISVGLFPTYTIDTDGDIIVWAKPTTVVVPPAAGGTVIIPPSDDGTVIVPPSDGGTVVVPPARP